MKDLYITSYYQKGSVALRIVYNKIYINNLPELFGCNTLLIEIYDYHGHLVLSDTVFYNKSNQYIQTNLSKNDIYFLWIYEDCSRPNYYTPIVSERDVPLLYRKGELRFVRTSIYKNNCKMISSINLERISQSYCTIDEIVSLAKMLKGNSHNVYNHILAVHDWVADNIYYDYDCRAQLSPRIDNPLEVLHLRRGVCLGYTNLSVNILSAMGIPACGVLCYTLDYSDGSGWEVSKNRDGDDSHIFTAAYFKNRWLLMDSTWDSPNHYENGQMRRDSGLISHKYFDVTMEFLSNTHKITNLLEVGYVLF